MPSHPRLRAKQLKAARTDAPATPSRPLFEPAEIEAVTEDMIPLHGEGYALVVRLSFAQNQLVAFFIGWFRTQDERTQEMFSVDTNHGWLHAHTSGHRRKKDRQNIRPLHTQTDVRESYAEAYDLVYTHYVATIGGESHEAQ